MTDGDGTGANAGELETGLVVESPQAGDDAGEHATRGNENRGLEEPTNGEDELEDELEDPDGEPSSDETDDDTPLVARLRQESGRYRRKLREREDELEAVRGELWIERVRSLELLADPTDLPFDPDALEDPDRLRELAEDLLARKPHLRSRRIRQRAGQGEGTNGGEVSLAALLQRGA